MKKKALISWSSGKDSAWTLHTLRRQGEFEVAGLLTTINSQFNRVAMHSTRFELLQAQAAGTGLPLISIPLPWPCSNGSYEAIMKKVCADVVMQGIEAIAFGDLFLRDIREYREKQLMGTGLTPVFPLWGMPTDDLARSMIAGGLKARLTCVDPRKLDASFAGRDFDLDLLAAIPQGVDPCGENGEFHTAVYAGPMFTHGIKVERGKVVSRDGFVFADIVPA